MRGAVPCLSADLTTHAVPLHTLQDLKVGGGVRVSVVAQERREVREREGFGRCALPVCERWAPPSERWAPPSERWAAAKGGR